MEETKIELGRGAFYFAFQTEISSGSFGRKERALRMTGVGGLG